MLRLLSQQLVDPTPFLIDDFETPAFVLEMLSTSGRSPIRNNAKVKVIRRPLMARKHCLQHTRVHIDRRGLKDVQRHRRNLLLIKRLATAVTGERASLALFQFSTKFPS